MRLILHGVRSDEPERNLTSAEHGRFSTEHTCPVIFFDIAALKFGKAAKEFEVEAYKKAYSTVGAPYSQNLDQFAQARKQALKELVKAYDLRSILCRKPGDKVPKAGTGSACPCDDVLKEAKKMLGAYR